MDIMSIVWMLVIGFVVGVLARFIKPGNDSMSWLWTILLGIGGSMLGGVLAGVLGMAANGLVMTLVFSVIGAIILLVIYNLIRKNV